MLDVGGNFDGHLVRNCVHMLVGSGGKMVVVDGESIVIGDGEDGRVVGSDMVVGDGHVCVCRVFFGS